MTCDLRKNLTIDKETMENTAGQLVLTIVSFKARKQAEGQRLSAKTISDLWNDKLNLKDNATHALSDTMIENAIAADDEMHIFIALIFDFLFICSWL